MLQQRLPYEEVELPPLIDDHQAIEHRQKNGDYKSLTENFTNLHQDVTKQFKNSISVQFILVGSLLLRFKVVTRGRVVEKSAVADQVLDYVRTHHDRGCIMSYDAGSDQYELKCELENLALYRLNWKHLVLNRVVLLASLYALLVVYLL
jgi:hypothetical protein